METKFNSQVCTNREQSQKLLEMGLKPETADMYHTTYCDANDNNNIVKYTCVRHKGLPLLSQDFPAWSLHRLIEFISNSSVLCMRPLYRITYDFLIMQIETYIKNGSFNKEYLNK